MNAALKFLQDVLFGFLGFLRSIIRTIFHVNGLGIFATSCFAIWAYYYFVYTGQRVEPPKEWIGVFVPARMWQNLAYFTVFYLMVEWITAALSAIVASANVKTKLVSLVNVGIAIVPMLMFVWFKAKASEFGITGDKMEHLNFCLVVSAADFFGGLALALLVAQRMFGFGGGGSSNA